MEAPGGTYTFVYTLKVDPGGSYTFIYALLYTSGFAVPNPDKLQKVWKSIVLFVFVFWHEGLTCVFDNGQSENYTLKYTFN